MYRRDTKETLWSFTASWNNNGLCLRWRHGGLTYRVTLSAIRSPRGMKTCSSQVRLRRSDRVLRQSCKKHFDHSRKNVVRTDRKDPYLENRSFMKVVLVNLNLIKVPAIAPYALDVLGSALEAAGHQVDVLDLCPSSDPVSSIHEYFSAQTPDLVGLSLRNAGDLYF